MDDNGSPRCATNDGTPVAGPATGGDLSWITEKLHDVRAPLVIELLANAAQVARARRAFAAWLALDIDIGDCLDDLVLVVYEALANATEHAYTGASTGNGVVHLAAHRSQYAVRITVRDCGRWLTATDAPFRRRGLPMMRQLLDHVAVDSGTAGTTVHLRTSLPTPHGTA
jgi:serine/threonine-protein kinase RsbW